MHTITLSPKFQIVIPKEIRMLLKLTAGTKLEILSYGDRIELIPLKPMKSLRGSLKGIDTTITREKDRL